MRLPAPAKINLHLRVGPPRADGFHPLLTWMVTVGLFDTLVFIRRSISAARRPRGRFSLSTDHPALPTDDRNLVTRVATALADALEREGAAGRIGEGSTGADRDGVSAFLNKKIPAGAGLGGGSSDAAAALFGLNKLWRANWSPQQLSDFAARFGSDLSFFFHGPSSVCTGRGEIVRPVPRPAISRWAVLVLPQVEMPTPAVYRRFDEMRLGREQDLTDEPDWIAWSSLPASELLPRLVNDLEPPAFAIKPELGELRAALEQKLSRIVRMSGSGSSLFTLCDDAAEAESLTRQARDASNVAAIAVEVAPEQVTAPTAAAVAGAGATTS